MNLDTTRDLLQTVEKAVHAVPELQSLRDDWLHSACDYAQKRIEWRIARKGSPDVLAEVDRERSHIHEGFIANCNALARNMRKAGASADWHDNIQNDRKAIGDLACWIHLTIALSAR